MDYELLEELYVGQRMKASEVASSMGCHVSTVERNLRKMGWTRGASERKIPTAASEMLSSKDRLLDLYVTRRLPAGEIASEFGVSYQTVRRALQRFGIALRDAGDSKLPEGALDVLEDREEMEAMYLDVGIMGASHRLGVNRQTISNYLAKHGIAVEKGSEGERLIADHLAEKFVVERNTRSIIPPLELDIFIPEKMFAVEFNGLYWHSEAQVGREYHKTKYDRCRDGGIRLVQIWEDDWANNPSLILRMLDHKLGVSDSERIHARQCSVVEVAHAAASRFYGQYHIQGATSASVHVGLESKDGQLVALCSFLNTSGADYDLVRFATSCTIPGALSKILKWFRENLEWTSIKTFADLALSDGDIYMKIGFKLDKTIPPDYRYVVGGVRQHKFLYRKSRFESDDSLFYDASMTEAELAKSNGLARIYDVGKLRFLMRNENCL